MDNTTIEILEFKKHNKTLNLDLKKDNEVLFNILLLLEYSSELRNGFMVKKQYKTTKKGTLFLFEPAKSQEEMDKYVEKLRGIIKEIGEQKILLTLKERLEQIQNEIEKELEETKNEKS